MDRRTFNKLASLAAIGALAEGSELNAKQSGLAVDTRAASAGEVVLQDQAR
jgi:hypothetical protein